MNFKGGVIVIGSLLWDDTPVRHKWRSANLQPLSTKQAISVPIRYGRKSSTRQDTYTMILSNNISTQSGRAYTLAFKDEIKNSRMLESQAFALGAAEGLWKEKPSISKNWGTVGLLLNPNIDNKSKVNANIIRQRWKQLYQLYQETFDHTRFQIESDELAVIDQDGFLQIPWTNEMDEYDFLLATPVVPDPHRLLTAEEVAEQMKLKKYRVYFDKNREHNIITFQDDEIIGYLNS